MIILNLMKINLLMNSQLSTGKISPILIWMQTLNLIFFYDQISQFINSHVPQRKLSKREIKLSTKPWITQEILAKMQYRDKGHFPFKQKFWKFRVWERMEQTFSGISFRNFGCTSRGWSKIPENWNNRKILFHSTIPTRAQFLRA